MHADKALQQGYIHPNKRIFNNAKVSDHFAIVPTGTVPSALSETEAKIYDLVARRFIAVFYPAAQFEVTPSADTAAHHADFTMTIGGGRGELYFRAPVGE